MAHLSADMRLLSPICDVVWAGWRTTTVDLQQAGWQIAVERQHYDFATRLLIEHRDMRLRGITNHVRLDGFMERQYSGTAPRPVFHVQWMASDFRVQLMESSFDFRQIDAKPQFTNEQIKGIDAFNIFAVPLARTEEIIVDQHDVSALLEQIRRMQAPEIAEIRKREQSRERRGDVEPKMRETFHAQILSFAA